MGAPLRGLLTRLDQLSASVLPSTEDRHHRISSWTRWSCRSVQDPIHASGEGPPPANAQTARDECCARISEDARHRASRWVSRF